jgi:hypothetical protein
LHYTKAEKNEMKEEKHWRQRPGTAFVHECIKARYGLGEAARLSHSEQQDRAEAREMHWHMMQGFENRRAG